MKLLGGSVRFRKKLNKDSIFTDLKRLFGDFSFDINNNQTSYDFDYILDRNDRIRWMYFSSIDKPRFLELYNPSNALGYLYVIGVRLLFELGLKALIRNGKFTISFNGSAGALAKLLEKNEGAQDLAIFFGTYGADRKFIATFRTKNSDEGVFAKIPLNQISERLVLSENENLRYLNKLGAFSFRVPSIVEYLDNEYLILTDAYSDKTHKKSVGYDDLKPIMELHHVDKRIVELKELRNLKAHKHDSDEENLYNYFVTLSKDENQELKDRFERIDYQLNAIELKIGLDRKISTSFSMDR